METRKQQERQEGLWIATATLPRTAGHPFYERLNELLEESGFDGFVEERCQRFYAPKMGRPSLTPGVYFRLLLVGYFEGLDSEREMAWRAADSLGMRRTHLRGHRNILKRLLIHVAAFNGSLILRREAGVGTPRACKGFGTAYFSASGWSRRSWIDSGNAMADHRKLSKPDGSFSRPSGLNRTRLETSYFYHGLLDVQNLLVCKSGRSRN